MASRKVILTCAITGSGHTPSMSPHLPYTIDDVVNQSIEAAEAGARSSTCTPAIRGTGGRRRTPPSSWNT